MFTAYIWWFLRITLCSDSSKNVWEGYGTRSFIALNSRIIELKVAVLLVVVLCSWKFTDIFLGAFCLGHHGDDPDVGKCLWNVSIILPHCMVMQPRRAMSIFSAMGTSILSGLNCSRTHMRQIFITFNICCCLFTTTSKGGMSPTCWLLCPWYTLISHNSTRGYPIIPQGGGAVTEFPSNIQPVVMEVQSYLQWDIPGAEYAEVSWPEL